MYEEDGLYQEPNWAPLKPEVLNLNYIHDHSKCASINCDKQSHEHYREVFITVRGHQRTLSFCLKHGPAQMKAEKLFAMGF